MQNAEIILLGPFVVVRYLDQEAERKRKLQEEILRREEEAKQRMAKVTKDSRTDIAKREVRTQIKQVLHTQTLHKDLCGISCHSKRKLMAPDGTACFSGHQRRPRILKAMILHDKFFFQTISYLREYSSKSYQCLHRVHPLSSVL